MAVTKSIAVSDALYARWIAYQQRHPDAFFNQVCREALEHWLKEDEACVTDAPTSTIR